MKALLLKDWYVLRKQAWAYLIIVLVWGAIPSEVLNLLAVVYGAMIPYTAMAYDQRSHWDRFARMLPYSDRTVVLSRYALGWVSLLIGTAAVTLCQGIVSCLPVRTEAAAGLSPALIYTALCVGTILLSINVPLTLRFGSEKARMVSVLITFLVFASVGFLKGLDAGSPAGAAAFPALLLPAALTSAPSLMVRGVLYTALTRARELLVIVGDDAAIRSMAANDRQQKRYSGLKWRLCHAGDANGE